MEGNYDGSYYKFYLPKMNELKLILKLLNYFERY